VGIFANYNNSLPEVVFQAGNIPTLILGCEAQVWQLPRHLQLFSILPVSKSLAKTECREDCRQDGVPCAQIHGRLCRVRVIEVVRGPKKEAIPLFYGKTQQLESDPAKFSWPKQAPVRDHRRAAQRASQGRDPPPVAPVPIMKYSAKMGRELLNKRHDIPNPVVRKWGGILVHIHKLRWNTVWSKARVNKETGLLWLIWHRAPAVNKWRSRINIELDTTCPVCGSGATESVLHRFWECSSARLAWSWGTHILNCLVAKRGTRGSWRPLNWKQGIFSDRIPRKFKQVQNIWMAVQGTMVWLLWMERNDSIFNDIKWPPAKLIQTIWLGLIDYGRLAWEAAKDKAKGKFINVWCKNGILAEMVMGRPWWKLNGPSNGFDVH
jgi:hypothetical protein